MHFRFPCHLFIKLHYRRPQTVALTAHKILETNPDHRHRIPEQLEDNMGDKAWDKRNTRPGVDTPKTALRTPTINWETRPETSERQDPGGGNWLLTSLVILFTREKMQKKNARQNAPKIQGIFLSFQKIQLDKFMSRIFLHHSQKHLAMAPWGATDGRATVPLDPIEDGKFGQQPFFHSKTKPPNSRTTSRRPKILLSYGSTILSHATAYEISPVHASNYLQKACTKTNGCIVCDEKWRDVLCCITRTRGNGSVNY